MPRKQRAAWLDSPQIQRLGKRQAELVGKRVLYQKISEFHFHYSFNWQPGELVQVGQDGQNYCCVSLVETFLFSDTRWYCFFGFGVVVFPLLAVSFRICLPAEWQSFIDVTPLYPCRGYRSWNTRWAKIRRGKKFDLYLQLAYKETKSSRTSSGFSL